MLLVAFLWRFPSFFYRPWMMKRKLWVLKKIENELWIFYLFARSLLAKAFSGWLFSALNVPFTFSMGFHTVDSPLSFWNIPSYSQFLLTVSQKQNRSYIELILQRQRLECKTVRNMILFSGLWANLQRWWTLIFLHLIFRITMLFQYDRYGG